MCRPGTAARPDISPAIRKDTCESGRNCYIIVVERSDSRVILESIFSAGIGELFNTRVAGNVMDDNHLGIVEYAADHLGRHKAALAGYGLYEAVLGPDSRRPAGR